MKALKAVGCAILAGSVSLSASEIRWSSGPDRVSLVELYTSEGCSSCPPAESWLDARRDDPGLWRNFVPIAFHVNYWDNLGWPDRFATRQFTQRQYAHATDWSSGSVYTPCFVRDGAEWHPESGRLLRSAASPGVLTVLLTDPGACHVEFAPDPGNRGGRWEAHVALLGGGFSSRVTAGENRGRTLTHEFVALQLVDVPMTSGEHSASANLALPTADGNGAVRRALAVWVTRPGELAPVQATGGWLPVRS